MAFVIQKNIPLPASLRATTESKYNFADMEVGDSFFVPPSELNENETVSEMRNRVYQAARAHATRGTVKKKFAAVVVEEVQPTLDEAGAVMENIIPLKVIGVRVWRLDDPKTDAPDEEAAPPPAAQDAPPAPEA